MPFSLVTSVYICLLLQLAYLLVAWWPGFFFFLDYFVVVVVVVVFLPAFLFNRVR